MCKHEHIIVCVCKCVCGGGGLGGLLEQCAASMSMARVCSLLKDGENELQEMGFPACTLLGVHGKIE